MMAKGTLLKGLYEAHYVELKRQGVSVLGEVRGPLFAEWIGTGRQIIDIGCRDGTLTRWFHKGNIVCGIDIAETPIRICQKSLGVSTILADINEPLPLLSESFDAAVLGEIIEHTYFPSKVLAECARVLKPGGLLLGSVPNGYHILKRWKFLMGQEPESEPLHFHSYSLRSLQRLLGTHFVVEEICPLGGRYRRISPALFSWYFAWRCRRTSGHPA